MDCIGIAQFCSPDFRIEVGGFSVPITAPNGMCSYGIGNVGTYNSTFTSTDIADQAFNNPAGHYDYEQLLGQAMNQTFIVTDLFENSDIPESLFSTFLPNEPMPSTEFLSASAPTAPPTVTVPTDPTVPINSTVLTDPANSSVYTTDPTNSIVPTVTVPTDPTNSIVPTVTDPPTVPTDSTGPRPTDTTDPPTDPTADSNSDGVGSSTSGSVTSFVFSCSLMAVLACSMLALLL